ncbi:MULTISPECIES: hypothetical protein [unclassified Francisella]|uniref:hypothetical protein n=1 Tax=unclassified Francisella TaxID=2610885 RepID=UPI002E314378|nr:MULTISPECIES: hypothetical protein [unclassified Francisella]MED7818517.1 hypothetical protein [Francisella sp. 19S2-4]MED7829353.1 hypothetical protein [Francisella sp. 19S2-10]
MSVTKESHQQSSDAENALVEQNQAKGPKAIVSKLGFVLSLVAIGMAGYVTVDSIIKSKRIDNENYQYTALEKQINKLKEDQRNQDAILNDIGNQSDSQRDSIKAVQTQLSLVNSQLSTPAKDLYMQMSIINIQSAIDYLILAKDVVIFSGDTQRANDLVSMAFDKIEASKVANISASDRLNIKNILKSYSSREDIIKEFINIEQQFGKLEYITPENTSLEKATQPKNKYMKLLSSIVEIQDIPKNQILVSTKQAKQFISDSLYQSLISLQTAMYTNNETDIAQAKANLIDILGKYFVQNSNAKDLEKTIQGIQARKTQDLDNALDKVITQLSNQQNELLTKESVFKVNASKKESNK